MPGNKNKSAGCQNSTRHLALPGQSPITPPPGFLPGFGPLHQSPQHLASSAGVCSTSARAIKIIPVPQHHPHDPPLGVSLNQRVGLDMHFHFPIINTQRRNWDQLQLRSTASAINSNRDQLQLGRLQLQSTATGPTATAINCNWANCNCDQLQLINCNCNSNFNNNQVLLLLQWVLILSGGVAAMHIRTPICRGWSLTLCTCDGEGHRAGEKSRAWASFVHRTLRILDTTVALGHGATLL